MQKQKQVSSHFQKQEKLIPSAQKAINLLRRTNLIGTSKTIKMKTRLSLATIPFLLIQVSFRSKPRPSKKINVTKKIVEKVAWPLVLIPLRL